MNDYLKFSSPGGESYNDLYNRVKTFITDRNITGNTLIITHAGVIRAFLAILTNIDSKKTFDLDIKYGEIVKI
jgi:alpha-ribazole phosphatase